MSQRDKVRAGRISMKVLIVGAGPTGLTAAIELSRKGISPTVIEKRESASTLSRAVGITPASLEIFSRSGAHESLIAEGIAIDELRVYHGQSLSLEMELRSQSSFHPNLVGLPQDRTEAILAETLLGLGTQVRYGCGFESLEQSSDSVLVSLSDGTKEAFDHVIGADGIGSSVREVAGIAFPGFDLEEKWSVADVELTDWRHPGCFTFVQAGRGKIAVVVPICPDRYRVVASTGHALEAMPLPLKVTNVRREGAFKISIRIAETYSKGRVHLAGDAAHAHSPVGGRGMNLGIADAAELSRRLIDGTMDEYSNARRIEALEVREMTERGRKMATAPNMGTAIVFRTLVGALSVLPPLRRKFGSLVVEF